MMRSCFPVCLLAIATLLSGTSRSVAATISAADFGTFRDESAPFGTISSGDGFFVQFLRAGFRPSFPLEDRGVVEFSLSSVSGPVASASLDLVLTRNAGDPSVTLMYDVLSYAGNGTVGFSEDSDFSAGVFAESFSVTSEPVGTVLQIDVTNEINALIANGDPFAGFNIRFSGPEPPVDRSTWLSGFSDGTNLPTLNVSEVPTPSTFAGLVSIMCFALIITPLARRRRHTAAVNVR